ncbi:LuxR C-terminal-related transcriptional regulator [Microvirga arabica]|uniref:LuxR C-terminal-related transcriptional regulator n=1 Tax=Microvirga arabica TaxID=1128671 RepID=A0ABV6Y651_9HYPH
MIKLDMRSVHMRIDETLSRTGQTQSMSPPLSDEEAQILLLIAAGHQNAEIAAAAGTDQLAVREHIKAILRKAIAAGNAASRPRAVNLRPAEFPSDLPSPFIA